MSLARLRARIFAVALAVLLAGPLAAQLADSTVRRLAEEAIHAWQLGERGGDYDAFDALLGERFSSFSHPFAGAHRGDAALATLRALIAERRAAPNDLTFSNYRYAVAGDTAHVRFRSAGRVGERIAYDGEVVAVFAFSPDGELVEFSEFLGLVDPAWFATE